MRVQPGTKLGPYEITAFIGAGGMGEVYRASDPRLGRDVAIKVLGTTPDSERLGRFEREARATAVLAHPNILTVFDIGTHEGMPFLVSELLQGQTLRDRLASGPLSPHAAVDIAGQIARGLVAAHALRIIHRDIKPDNLFITRDDIVKILDFGLAKLAQESVTTPDATTIDASAAGHILGTPGYMAPEQVRGEVVCERSDIFALGIVLHEMLCGVSPFRRSSGAATFAAILHDDPIDQLDRAGVKEALKRLVRRCIEKDPAARFNTAADLAAALEWVKGDLTATSAAKPASPAPVPAAQSTAASIAVMPFSDMSPARDQDYLCEGIAEELITSLSRIDGLRVAARSSTFQFKDAGVDVRAIGARLGVASVLEGGVRKLGDRLRVSVQLIDVNDGYQRWAQRYDRNFEDVFAIQDEIAESVATALRGILTPNEKESLRRQETATEAYEYFLRGRQLQNQGQRTSFSAAKEMFRRAIDADPAYGPAYAGLADVHAWFYEWFGGGIEDLKKADEASRKALELSPGRPEGHTSRAFVLATQQRYDEAAHEFEEAIRIDPKSFEACYLYGRMCFAWGKLEQSAELFQRAADARPEDFQSMILLGQSLQIMGREEDARKATREGIRRAESRLELDPNDGRALSLGANALAEVGQLEKALRWSERAVEHHPAEYSVLLNAACLRAKSGLKEEAFHFLEQTFALGFGKRDWIDHDPDYDSLRDDPRFQAMLKKLK